MESTQGQLEKSAFRFFVPQHAEKNFQPHVSVYLEYKNYVIKTVDNSLERQQAYELRHEVFYGEMTGSCHISGVDTDEFDQIADLLIIKDMTTGKLIGTYRFIASCFETNFYSATEFDLSSFFATPGVKLELSRACIDREHRNGLVISLLWKGLSDYAFKTGAKYLFGCSSVWTPSLPVIHKLNEHFSATNRLVDHCNITPLPAYDPSNNPMVTHTESAQDVKELIPPLLRSYLKAGARVSPNVAFDKAFNCFDYLTILDLETLNKLYERKFR